MSPLPPASNGRGTSLDRLVWAQVLAPLALAVVGTAFGVAEYVRSPDSAILSPVLGVSVVALFSTAVSGALSAKVTAELRKRRYSSSWAVVTAEIRHLSGQLSLLAGLARPNIGAFSFDGVKQALDVRADVDGDLQSRLPDLARKLAEVEAALARCQANPHAILARVALREAAEGALEALEPWLNPPGGSSR